MKHDSLPEARASYPSNPRGIEDRLQAMTEREDLQQLYERKVPVDQIVRLLGRGADRGQIDHLLGCDDPHREIRRILGSA